MPTRDDAQRRLSRFFKRHPVADLQMLQRLFGTTSRTTVFRQLSQVGYVTSYSHAGRYYTLKDIPDFDKDGLWAHGDALFSCYGTLRATIVQFVQNAPAGRTHAELRERLRLRVQDTVRALAKSGAIGRVQLERLFVYVSVEQAVAHAQVAQRRRLLGSQPSPVLLPPATVIIEVLLEIIHGARARGDPAAVAAQLDARGIAVTVQQVEEILQHYGVEKKTAKSRSRHSPR